MPPVLIPNIGAEEWPRGLSATGGQRVDAARRRIAGLWSWLFGPGVRIDGLEAPGWPVELGERPDEPVFPWLQGKGALPWLATDAAAQRARDLGLPLLGPPPAIVARVHDKAFAREVAIHRGLEPETVARRVRVFAPRELAGADAAVRVAAAIRSWGDGDRPAWILKARWSGSGRGGVRGAGLSRVDIPRLARLSGAVLEPLLEVIAEITTQLHVAPDGTVEVLGVTRQLVSRAGSCIGNRGVVSAEGMVCAGSAFEAEAIAGARIVGGAAAAESFRGVCGVDAMVYRGPAGPTLRPVGELNARFTVGTLAVGLVRRGLGAGLVRPSQAWCALVSPAARHEQALAAGGATLVRLDPGGAGAGAVLLAFAPDEATLDAALDARTVSPS